MRAPVPGVHMMALCACVWGVTSCSDRSIPPLDPTIPVDGVTDHTEFADAGLERAVRQALDQPRGELTPSTLGQLQGLDASDHGVVDLDGIERLFGLRQLLLAHNRVRDLTPLGRLDSLRELDLSHNRLVTLGTLSGLQQLTHLNLDFNSLFSITPLAALPRLNLLNLTDNRIRDISALVELSELHSVEISGNPLDEAAAWAASR